MKRPGEIQRSSWRALVLAAVLATPAGTWAAAPANDASSGGAVTLEGITVTARKTTENLQITPVAVTALSAASLTTNQQIEVKTLQGPVPNLAIGGAGTGPTSLVYLAIRGEGQNSPNSASDAAVGIYVDNYVGLGTSINYLGDPRTYGISMRYKF